ncbi:alpha-glucosidase, partial [Spirosoma sp.]|uniref:alpha-glucosidase n=1 Tax=Spirosoma sp. TaxID=1899569 RepID=UPI003B3AF3AD
MQRRNFLTLSALTVGSATFARNNADQKRVGVVEEQYPIGDFILQRMDKNQLQVVHKQLPGRILWQSAADGNFIIAEKATASVESFGEPEGSFTITDKVQATYDRPSIDQIVVSGNKTIVSGKLAARTGSIGYTVSFNQVASAQLQFEVKTDNMAKGVNRIRLRLASSADENFFGFGHQLTFFNQKHNKLPILVQEHGVGRGRSIVTEIIDAEAKRGGRNPYVTEAPAPHYITSKLQSLCLENTEYSEFDMKHATYTDIKLWSGVMTGRILFGATPLDLIETYTAYCGRMRALPDWVHQGVIVSVQGGSLVVQEKLDKLRKAQVPMAGLWIQDWCGVRLSDTGSQLWWNWVLDDSETSTGYFEWRKLVAELENQGARMLIYINPFLSIDAGDDPSRPRNSLYLYGKERGYLVNDPKKNGEPYQIKNTNFYAAMVDLSNPQAKDWMKSIIKNNMISKDGNGAGASGWMADFGEALPFTSELYGDADPYVWHNHYTEQWAQLNREAIREAGREDDILFFNRSGFTHSPGYSTLFWLGDQLQSWDEYDGIKTAVVGMLSGGMSGFSLIHSDTGGYVSLKIPPNLTRNCDIPIIYRTDELFQRWMELSAFTAVFRTHEGYDPKVAAQFNSSQANTEHLARFGKVYKGLATYRKQVVAEATLKGYPVARHLFLHYPDDHNTYALRYQYLLGRDLLVAPVLDKGATSVEVYFPVGDEW